MSQNGFTIDFVENPVSGPGIFFVIIFKLILTLIFGIIISEKEPFLLVTLNFLELFLFKKI